MKQGWKYLLILILFLIPGIELFNNDSASSNLSQEDTEEGVVISHQKMASSQEFYTVMLDTFSAICRVESLKVESRNYCRDFSKYAYLFSKNIRIPVKRLSYSISDENVVAGRYVEGVYIYFHKLII